MTTIPCVTEEVLAPIAAATPNPCPIDFSSLSVLQAIRSEIDRRMIYDTMNGKYTGATQRLLHAFNNTEASKLLAHSLADLDELQEKYDAAYARNEIASILGPAKALQQIEKEMKSLHWQMNNLRSHFIQPAADHIWSLIARA